MPIPKLMTSPVLEPKKIKATSLPKIVISYHVKQATQTRIIDPKAISNGDVKTNELVRNVWALSL